jgi:site-specific DNA recombinase
MKYFVYCRKSTDDEDHQILSIESQRGDLEKRFFGRDDISVVDVFEEARTAKTPGRPIFEEMIKRIKRGEAEGIIAWHPDRLARNSIDGGQIIYFLDLGILKDLRFSVYNFENNSQGKFMLGIMFSNSKYYSDILSENVKRGNRTKVEKGWRPGTAPIGYLNDKETKITVKDPQRFPVIRQLWDLMLTGTYSPNRIHKIATEELGLRTLKRRRSGGGPLALSALYSVFRNRFYTGIIEWEGKLYKGKHESMVNLEEFDRVQKLLAQNDRPRPKTHTFTYTGLIHCGECGLSVTAEEKVNRYGYHYTYYHCTKKKLDYKCIQHCIELDDLEKDLLVFLQKISISDKIHNWALGKLNAAFAKRRTDAASNRISLEQAVQAVTRELENLTTMRIRDLIGDEEFVTRRKKFAFELMKTRENLEKLKNRGLWLEPARMIVSFNNRAILWFREGDAQTKRLILEIVGSNLQLKDKKLLIEAKKPFRQRTKICLKTTRLTRVEDVRTRTNNFVKNIAEMADTEEFRVLIHKLKMLFLKVGYTEGVNKLIPYLPPPVEPLFDLGEDDQDEAA